MSPTLKEVFDDQFKTVTFDDKLCKRIIQFSQNFMTANDDHSAFFGGVLMGVHPIRFLERDRDTWYEDVLEIDENLLVSEFRKVKSVTHTYNVMADVFNYTPVYVAHRLDNNTRIPQKLRQETAMHAFMVLHYRFLTSLLVPRFRYSADPEVAQAAYNSLSNRYDLKRYGSWRALLEARSREFGDINSIYRQTIKNFRPDDKVIRVVTDTQGRIREVVKKLYAVHIQCLESGNRVRISSAQQLTLDGEVILRDKTHGYSGYLRYINEVIPNQRSFIRGELEKVVSDAMRTMPPKLLNESLQYLSSNYQQRGQAYLEELVKETLLYMFDYLQTNRAMLGRTNDIGTVMMRLRSLVMASRSSDPSVLKLRELSDKLVRKAVKTRTDSVIASVRTGVLLYIVLRAMTKQYYTQ